MLVCAGCAAAMASCSQNTAQEGQGDFKYLVDEFADLKIMKYQVPGWENLSLQQKEYVYHLSEAAKYGRDIIWAQNCDVNLPIRKAVEKIITDYDGCRECPEYQDFLVYAKRLFFSNGIHHHYAEDKFFPACPEAYFANLMKEAGVEGDHEALLKAIYDPEVYPQRKSNNPDGDIVAESAVDFYDNVTREEVEAFYDIDGYEKVNQGACHFSGKITEFSPNDDYLGKEK